MGWVNMETLKAKRLFLMIGELRGFELNGNGVNLLRIDLRPDRKLQKEELWIRK
jgi:hypothetical protein